jgi:VWFA-related protein
MGALGERRSLTPVVLPAVLLLVAQPVSPGADPQRPVFRSEVELVEVDVVAVDADGRPVRDLRREEFDVFEDGRRREIVSFGLVDLPRPQPQPPAWRDVSTNAGVEDGRVVVLILDDVNTTRGATDVVRAIARELIARLGPEDRAAVVWTSLKKAGARELTTNHAALLEALEGFAGDLRPVADRAGPSLLRAPGRVVEEDATRETGGGAAGPADLKRFFDALRPFTMVADVSRTLEPLPHRRKAVVYIGEGLRPLGPEPMRTGTAEYAGLDLQRAIAAARRANVAVYLLDPHAPLRAGAEGLFEDDGARDVTRLRGGDFRAFAAATGGFSAVGPVTTAQIERILSDTGTYYLLGYEATRSPPAGVLERLKRLIDPWAAFRRIEVRTTRPGVRLRARWGYVADMPRSPAPRPATNASDRVWDAVRAVVPRGELSLRAYAAAFRGRGAAHPVALVVEVEDATLVADGDRGFSDTVTLAVVAYETGGRIRATERAKVALGLGGRPGGAAAAGRYAVCSALALPPGHYQVRVGVHSARAGKTGSIYHDVTVPDFGSRRVALSDVVLEQRRDGLRVPVARARTVAAIVPVWPSLGREFRRTDRVSAVVRVYRTGEARGAEVRLEAKVTALATGERVWAAQMPASFSATDEAEGRFVLPVATLADGGYRFSVTARDAEGRWGDERRLDFRVGDDPMVRPKGDPRPES